MRKVRVRVVLSGRVQGVFFRESTRREALELGVCGYVRNLPDGRVEAVFEGDEPAVQQAIRFVCVGPPLARVVDPQIMAEPWESEFDDFRIAR